MGIEDLPMHPGFIRRLPARFPVLKAEVAEALRQRVMSQHAPEHPPTDDELAVFAVLEPVDIFPHPFDDEELWHLDPEARWERIEGIARDHDYTQGWLDEQEAKGPLPRDLHPDARWDFYDPRHHAG